MAYQVGTANGYLHLLDLLQGYVRGYSIETGRSYTAGTATVTGNGTLERLTAKGAITAQTFTVSCVTAGSAGLFAVVGSSAGTVGTATVGTNFTSTLIDFLLVDGTTDFAADNKFTVVVGNNNLPSTHTWAVERFTGGGVAATGPVELILRGQGAGTDSIYCGVLTVTSATGDYHNWKLGGFTGYASASAFELQPGYWGEGGGVTQPHPIHTPLWNSDIPYWFVVNGRRIIVVAKISTVYEIAYLGFINSYATPGQYPYPLFIGGTMSWDIQGSRPAADSTSWRWSNAGQNHSHFWSPFTANAVGTSTPQGSQARLRGPSGAWRDFFVYSGGAFNPFDFTIQTATHTGSGSVGYENIPTQAERGAMWPVVTSCDLIAPNLDDSYTPLPHVLMSGNDDWGAADLFGELDGVRWITGQGVAVEDVVEIDSVPHLVVQNVFRTTRISYSLVELS